MKLLLAHSSYQAKKYAGLHGLAPDEYRVIYNLEGIRGYRGKDFSLILIGNYYDRPDATRIIFEAKTHDIPIVRA